MLKEFSRPDPENPTAGAPSSGWRLIPFPPSSIFTTSRLVIRPYHINDAPYLARIANNPKIARNQTNRFPSPYSINDALAFINRTRPGGPDSKKILTFTIVLRDGPDAGTVVGGCGLEPGQDVFRRSCDVGYWVGEEFWGKGYATEVTSRLVDYAFTLAEADGFGGDKSFVRLGAGVFSGNPASEKVLTKCGFTNEGILRQTVWKFGERRDLVVFAILREEWEQRRQ